MNTEPKSNDLASDASEVKQQPSCCMNTDIVAEMLKNHVKVEAKQRTIRQTVSGRRFCAVMLDDGSVGVAHICCDVCGTPPQQISDWLPQPETPAIDALETLTILDRAHVGLATANALTNRSYPSRAGHWGNSMTEGDLLDVLKLKPDDRVGMVGCFSPLVHRIRHCVQRLFIFERSPRLTSDLLPEHRAIEVLPECSVALITSTTIMNSTIDALLLAATNCREVVLLGPSTPLIPKLFAEPPRRASLLSGVVVTDAEELLRTVARGGGTRDFKTCVAKVNIIVNATGEH